MAAVDSVVLFFLCLLGLHADAESADIVLAAVRDKDAVEIS